MSVEFTLKDISRNAIKRFIKSANFILSDTYEIPSKRMGFKEELIGDIIKIAIKKWRLAWDNTRAGFNGRGWVFFVKYIVISIKQITSKESEEGKSKASYR